MASFLPTKDLLALEQLSQSLRAFMWGDSCDWFWKQRVLEMWPGLHQSFGVTRSFINDLDRCFRDKYTVMLRRYPRGLVLPRGPAARFNPEQSFGFDVEDELVGDEVRVALANDFGAEYESMSEDEEEGDPQRAPVTHEDAFATVVENYIRLFRRAAAAREASTVITEGAADPEGDPDNMDEDVVSIVPEDFEMMEEEEDEDYHERTDGFLYALGQDVAGMVVRDLVPMKSSIPRDPLLRLIHKDMTFLANQVFEPRPGSLQYYEVLVVESSDTIGVGFCMNDYPVYTFGHCVGWHPNSIGYHSDDGHLFTGTGEGEPFHVAFGKDAVVGCGVDWAKSQVFYTLNGKLIPRRISLAYMDELEYLIPAISLTDLEGITVDGVLINFGQDPFVYKFHDFSI